ncbi:MAG TPA: LUD domain-containing protein [Anaeromyxobacteraceae bacterium]|jgi:L-lactate dehydrogenase complex protein LldG|nr:LUD domain-containing protein [Anaeromyxobacteraceae bacterium]
MDSKRAILEALRRSAVPAAPLPEQPAPIRYADPEKQFGEALTSVGGRFLRAADAAGLSAQLAALEPFAGARRMVSLVPGVGRSDLDLSAVSDPHQLEGLDFAVLPGAFGVAENGAVWVEGASLPLRALFVIPQHLALVVPAGALVETMQDAYRRISFSGTGFGVFVSGPSKTADIEQALVIGAHGARSCAVAIVG